MHHRLRWLELPMHPMLISAAFVLNLAFHNEVTPAGYVRALLASVLLSALLIVVAYAVARRWSSASLAATAVILLLILPVPSYGVLRSAGQVLGAALATGALALAVILVVGVPAALALRARRRKEPFPWPSTATLNVLSLGLVGVLLATQAATVISSSRSGGYATPPAAGLSSADDLPDIYVILLDGYPRDDVLRQRFSYDNRQFLDHLGQRGLTVVADSHSNYTFTLLTLVTMLEMRHVDAIPSLREEIGRTTVRVAPIQDAVTDSTAIDVLRQAGYSIVATDSGYEHATLRGASDRFMSRGGLTDFERAVLERTLLLDLVGLARPYWFATDQRDRIVGAFEDLQAIAASRDSMPRFVIGHIPAPHLPVVTDAHGNPVPLRSRSFDLLPTSSTEWTGGEFNRAFADGLEFLNGRTLAAVDAIRAGNPGVPAVIVVMSDHGWTFSDDGDQPGRLANLFAYSTPGAPGLLDGRTPVNFLAEVLNRYLATNILIAPNRYFLSPPDPRNLMQLSEIQDPSFGR